MATASVTNTLVTATTVTAAAHNTNFSDLVTFLNTQVLHLDGAKTMSGNLPMGGNKVTGLAAGTVSGDAARYDELNSHGHSMPYLPLAGGTLTGALKLKSGVVNDVSMYFTGQTVDDGIWGDADEISIGWDNWRRVSFWKTYNPIAPAADRVVLEIRSNVANRVVRFTREDAGSDSTYVWGRAGAADGSWVDYLINGTTVTSSSRELKENIAELEGADELAFLQDVRPQSYTWRSSGKPGVGFIAEDVEELRPDDVTYDEDGVIGLTKDTPTVMRLAAIILHLEERIAELEQR